MTRLLCLLGFHDWYTVRIGHATRPVQYCRRPLCTETWRWAR